MSAPKPRRDKQKRRTAKEYLKRIKSKGAPNVPRQVSLPDLPDGERIVWYVPNIKNALIEFIPLDQDYVTNELMTGAMFGLLEVDDLKKPEEEIKTLLVEAVKNNKLDHAVNKMFPGFIRKLIVENHVSLRAEHMEWGRMMLHKMGITDHKNEIDVAVDIIDKIMLRPTRTIMDTGETVLNPDRKAFLNALTQVTKQSMLKEELFLQPDGVNSEAIDTAEALIARAVEAANATQEGEVDLTDQIK